MQVRVRFDTFDDEIRIAFDSEKERIIKLIKEEITNEKIKEITSRFIDRRIEEYIREAIDDNSNEIREFVEKKVKETIK